MSKNNIEYENIATWSQLHSLIDGSFTHFNTYIFRGHAQDDWILEPTLTRKLRKNYPNTQEWPSVTKQHLTSFKENIRGRCNIDLINTPEDELWALGQHHGLYTPLLDWSKSPYVALFFALQDACRSESKLRTLWALHAPDIDHFNKENLKKKGSPGQIVKLFIPMTHENKRLVSQGGVFLRVPIGTDIESWVTKGSDIEWVTLYKINFPDSIRDEVIKYLDNVNINYNSLFPDLNGSSQHCNYLFEIEPYLEKKRDEAWNQK